ncbi:regulatory protein RecX [Vibrio mimicus VM223]|nr:regulatory protein RecX [Vibrio mimicus VM223]
MVHKGYGEQRLRQQLKEKRVAEEVIEQVLTEQTIDWFELAKEVAHKKFKSGISLERSQYAKQVRYLQYRGFNFDQIRYALQASESDE